MADAIPRIAPGEVRAKLARGEPTLLVCAYDDPAKCRAHSLPGAIHLDRLHAMLPNLSKQQEIVFYCA